MQIIRSIAQESSDFFLHIDKDCKIIWANKKMLENFKFSEDITGKVCYEVFFNKYKPCNNCPLITSIEKKKYEKGIVNPEFNTTYFISAYPIKCEDGNCSFLGVMSDSTESRVTVPDSVKELCSKTQNSMITTFSYLMNLEKSLCEDNDEIKCDFESIIYSMRTLFYKIQKEISSK